MIKKIVCKLLVMIIVIMMISTTALGSELYFDDIENHWAKNEIYEMAEKWVIYGYGDGTFKPDNNIIKAHAFLMFSRIKGYNNQENELILQLALDKYKEKLEDIEITVGVPEIAYLIEKGIVNFEDVENLLGYGKQNEELSREEAAYILVLLLGDNEKLNRFPLVMFDDTSEMLEKYLTYIEYVNKIGLMIGYDNKFTPKASVTRAQMATILSRMETLIYNRTVENVQGIVENVDVVSGLIEIRISAEETKEYCLARNLKVYEKDIRVSKTLLKKNDYITAYISDGQIEKISISNNIKRVFVSYVGFEKELSAIIVNQDKGQRMYQLIDDVIIKDINGKDYDLEDIKKDENLELKIVNNMITDITVGAYNYFIIGSVQEIVIGFNDSYLSIKDLIGNVNNYKISKDIKYNFDGTEGSIYDLRLNMEIKCNITHAGITKIDVETLNDIEIISGWVEQVLPQIYVFTIKKDDDTIMIMFLDKDETRIKSNTGVVKTIDDIKINNKASVYGRFDGEAFYPIQVILY